MNTKASVYKGIICIILSALSFAFMNAFVRLSGDLPTIQKCFFRNLMSLFIALFIMLKNRQPLKIQKKNLPYLFLRAACGTIGMICNFYAVDHLVLSDASILNKMSPFFAIVFSFLLLKEKVSLPQALIVLGAFIGSLFVVKPSSDIFSSPASLIGLIGGIGAGAAYTMVRKLSTNGENKSMIVLFFSAFSCIVTLIPTFFVFKPMSVFQLLALIGAGFGAAGGQFAITAAYYYAPAKEISVYDYSQLIFSMILGFLMFSQVSDFISIIGYIIIIAMAITMFIYSKNKKGPKTAL